MLRIALLSDTHGYLDQGTVEAIAGCDEIWHAGDIGNSATVEVLESIRKPLRMVWGNIDGRAVRVQCPEWQDFEVEGVQVLMTHIGGYPPRYVPAVKKILEERKPHLFICGHSHVLRVMRDAKIGNLLYLNPGAAGIEGFHKVRTLLRFTLSEGQLHELEAVELGKRLRTLNLVKDENS
jgi:putative phosphoesterase